MVRISRLEGGGGKWQLPSVLPCRFGHFLLNSIPPPPPGTYLSCEKVDFYVLAYQGSESRD
jgi:hypothetical protein